MEKIRVRGREKPTKKVVYRTRFSAADKDALQKHIVNGQNTLDKLTPLFPQHNPSAINKQILLFKQKAPKTTPLAKTGAEKAYSTPQTSLKGKIE